MMNNQTKIALITGAEQGIGKAIRDKFLAEGFIVYGTTRKSTSQRIERYHPLVLDLTDALSITEFTRNIDQLARLDVFINNAGVYQPEHSTKLTAQAIENTLAINLTAPMKILPTILNKMAKSEQGKILLISSIAATVSKENASAYGASKAGLLALSRTLALEHAAAGILVNTLSPGPTHTPMVDRLLDENARFEIAQNIPLGRLANTDEIAEVAYFLCSNKNSYITGQNIIADGGFTCK
tara:strand:- start:1335 stop:2054 length:720 start_codon:yes stop_codon:yes gene_type:complete